MEPLSLTALPLRPRTPDAAMVRVQGFGGGKPAAARKQQPTKPNVSKLSTTQRSSASKVGLGTTQRSGSKAGEPIGMTRAKAWSQEVEEAFRLQEAGWRGVAEMLALGLELPERWPESGFIRKLQTRHSFESGARVLLYFRHTPECESRYLNRVKLYRFA